MRSQAVSFCIVVAAGVAASATSVADTVHLHNGNSLEGVVLEETEERVRLRLAFGEIGLPRSSVARVERNATALEEFLYRRQELQLRRAAAIEWLELALWARSRELDHSSREAARVAARLDPGLDGLEPLMHEMGYVRDEGLDRWIPYEDYMRSRGYRLVDGRWLTGQELEAIERARATAWETRRSQARQDRLAQAFEMLLVAQLAQAEEDRRQREAARAGVGYPVWGYPVAFFPGSWLGVQDMSRPGAESEAQAALRSRQEEALLRRQTGSLIPARPVPGHRGRLSKAGGSEQ